MKSSTGNRIWGLGATENPVSYQCPLPSRFGTLNSKFNISSFTSVFGVQCSIFSVSNDRSYASAWARTILKLSGNGYLYQEPIMIEQEYELRKGRSGTIKDISRQSLKAYPNPANDFVNIDLSECIIHQNDKLIVTDLNSKELYRTLLSKGQHGCVIGVEQWKPGIYMITLWQNEQLPLTVKVTLSK